MNSYMTMQDKPGLAVTCKAEAMLIEVSAMATKSWPRCRVRQRHAEVLDSIEGTFE
jgi:hypothetical protein